MSAPLTNAMAILLEAARGLAAEDSLPLDSGHLLLALARSTNHAAALLCREGIDDEAIEDLLDQLDLEPEPHGSVDRLWQRCQQMALVAGSRNTGELHLLAAMVAIDRLRAFRVLAATGVGVQQIRGAVLEWIELEKRGQLHQLTSRPAAPGGAGIRPVPPRTASAPASGRGGSTPGAAAGPSAPSVPPPVVRDQPSPPAPARLPGPAVGGAPSRPPAPAPLGPAPPAAAPPREPPAGARWRLDAAEYPTLTSLGRNLTLLAAQGRIDPLVGREKELDQVIDILLKRRANNPCLVGEPGVGKTAIAEGLALGIAQGRVPAAMAERVIIGLDVGGLVGGTQLRGAFNERMALLKGEVAKAAGRVIVFIDEIHTLLGAGATGEGALDAAAELKQALAAGSFPCLGATTTDEYRRYIEEDSALERRFQPVVVEEPDEELAVAILQGLTPRYAAHHQVHFTAEALRAAVRLAARYVTERFLPDKAVNLLDLAGARARRQGESEVGQRQIAEVVARLCAIPLERLLLSEGERFLRMEEELGRAIIGHRPQLQRICATIRRNQAGFSTDRPIGSFLFLGPTGVGKTETVKALADFLFQSREAMIRLDMSEYMESHAVARMIGSPPGYVGHEEGGQLTEAVRRRPYQIVLLDEVEKAHRDVLNVLLQVLDEGRLTDGRGRTVDLKNTVVVMTSNLGSQHYGETRRAIGFGATERGSPTEDAELTQRVLETAKAAFPIELWNRIEERLVFAPLAATEVFQVARLQIRHSSQRLEAERRISFVADDSAIEYLIRHGGYQRELGARPMRTTIQRLIEGPIAELILAGRVSEGDRLRIHGGTEGRELIFDRLVPSVADSRPSPATTSGAGDEGPSPPTGQPAAGVSTG